MKNYKVNQSWEFLPYDVKCKVNCNFFPLKPYSIDMFSDGYVHISLSTTLEDMRSPVFVQRIKSAYGNAHIQLFTYSDEISAPVFVHSLVSPHGNGIMKRKEQAMNSNESRKVGSCYDVITYL